MNWPDPRLGPFAPRDPRFPLPGNVGLDLSQAASVTSPPEKVEGSSRKSLAEALLELELEDIKKTVVMDTFLKDVTENNDIQVGIYHCVSEERQNQIKIN